MKLKDEEIEELGRVIKENNDNPFEIVQHPTMQEIIGAYTTKFYYKMNQKFEREDIKSELQLIIAEIINQKSIPDASNRNVCLSLFNYMSKAVMGRLHDKFSEYDSFDSDNPDVDVFKYNALPNDEKNAIQKVDSCEDMVDLYNILDSVLSEMTEQQKKIGEKYFLEESTVMEISNDLGCTHPYISKVLRKIRKKLEKEVTKSG